MKRNNYTTDQSDPAYHDNREKLTVYHCSICGEYETENGDTILPDSIDEVEINVNYIEEQHDECIREMEAICEDN